MFINKELTDKTVAWMERLYMINFTRTLIQGLTYEANKCFGHSVANQDLINSLPVHC